MLVLTPLRLTLIAVGTCLVLPFVLAMLARNRGRTVLTWALVGAIPVVNIGGLIILLWTPLLAEQEAIRQRELAWQASMKGDDEASPVVKTDSDQTPPPAPDTPDTSDSSPPS